MDVHIKLYRNQYIKNNITQLCDILKCKEFDFLYNVHYYHDIKWNCINENLDLPWNWFHLSKKIKWNIIKKIRLFNNTHK